MNDVHRQAMDFAGRGLIARQRGNPDEAIACFQQALDYELKALAELTEPIEPTHSVLHRSAATLAMDCGDDRLAEKLAAKALAEEPPWGDRRGTARRVGARSTLDVELKGKRKRLCSTKVMSLGTMTSKLVRENSTPTPSPPLAPAPAPPAALR